MKQVLSVIGLVAILLSFVGCGGEASQDAQTTTTADTTMSTIGSAADIGTTQTTAKPSATTTSTTTTTKVTKESEFRMRYYNRYKKYINVRGGVKNTGYKIADGSKLTIAFMGGSVTGGQGSANGTNGFRGRLLANLNSAYKNDFYEITASLGGNGSQYATYVVDQFVASKKPDLVFLEFAVNNAYDGVKDADTLWNHYETMIHLIRKANPYADIIFVYVSDKDNVSKDVVPIVEEIAEKYNLPSINAYQAINSLMRSNGNGWEYYYSDGVHMSDNGYDIVAEMMQGLIESGLTQKPFTYQKMSTPTPKTAIQSEAKAVLTSALSTIPSGWTKNATFSYVKSTFGGCIETTQANKSITVKFKGTDFGILVEFSKDAGVLEYSIDGGVYQRLDCKLNYSNPKARPLLKNGTNGDHTITLRMTGEGRLAIAAFLLNGSIQSVG